MASFRRHRYSPVSYGSPCPLNPRRGSTSQMCLRKILTIITTIQPPPLAAAANLEVSVSQSTAENEENQRSGTLDLNIGLCVSPELKEYSEFGDASGLSSSGSSGAAIFKSSSDRRNNNDENSGGGVKEADRNLTLLIEAAELIFGDFEADGEFKSESDRENQVKKDEAAAEIEVSNEIKLRSRAAVTAAGISGDFDGTTSSAVIRTKRGRPRTLPCKYRDSILEPLTRRSSSIFTTNRRRR